MQRVVGSGREARRWRETDRNVGVLQTEGLAYLGAGRKRVASGKLGFILAWQVHYQAVVLLHIALQWALRVYLVIGR